MKNTANSVYIKALVFRISIATLLTFPYFYASIFISYFFRFSGTLMTLSNVLYIVLPFGSFILLDIPARKFYEKEYNVNFHNVNLKFFKGLLSGALVIVASYAMLYLMIPLFI